MDTVRVLRWYRTHGSDTYCRCSELEDHASAAHARTVSAARMLRRSPALVLVTKSVWKDCIGPSITSDIVLLAANTFRA